jgi:hypothetical protein
LAGIAVLAKNNEWNDDWTTHSDFHKLLCNFLEEKGYCEFEEFWDILQEACGYRGRADYEPFPVEERQFNTMLTICRPTWDALRNEIG